MIALLPVLVVLTIVRIRRCSLRRIDRYFRMHAFVFRSLSLIATLHRTSRQRRAPHRGIPLVEASCFQRCTFFVPALITLNYQLTIDHLKVCCAITGVTFNMARIISARDAAKREQKE